MVKAQRDCFTTSVAEKLKWFKQATWDGELSRQAQWALKELLEGALEEDINHQLGISRAYERTGARDQRNGYYTRSLETQRGTVPALRVPRSRQGSYTPRVFSRYQRRSAETDELICEMFLGGVSTRRVGELLELLTGQQASATTVSRVTRVLDPLVAVFHQRSLPDDYLYLMFDGIWLRCKGAQESRKVVVLVAYGITADGRRELIDFCQARGESEAEWSRFLNNLHRRGLRGDALQVVTTDGAPGLIAALDLVYPLARRQRCWVHKLRNVSNKLRQRHREPCLQEARAIYQAPTRREAVRCFRAWRRHWEPLEPKAAACLAQDIDALLVCFEAPVTHRKKIRTTNPLERAFREVRRRTNPMSCLNNHGSVERITFAVVNHQNAKWSRKPLPEFTQNT
jgi:putative transposase